MDKGFHTQAYGHVVVFEPRPELGLLTRGFSLYGLFLFCFVDCLIHRGNKLVSSSCFCHVSVYL